MLRKIKMFVLLLVSKHYHRQYDKYATRCYDAYLKYGEYSDKAEYWRQEKKESLIKWNKVTLKLQQVMES